MIDNIVCEGIADIPMSYKTEIHDIVSTVRSDGFPHGKGDVGPINELDAGFLGTDSSDQPVSGRVFVEVRCIVAIGVVD